MIAERELLIAQIVRLKLIIVLLKRENQLRVQAAEKSRVNRIINYLKEKLKKAEKQSDRWKKSAIGHRRRHRKTKRDQERIKDRLTAVLANDDWRTRIKEAIDFINWLAHSGIFKFSPAEIKLITTSKQEKGKFNIKKFLQKLRELKLKSRGKK